jgi:hypothetical protein
MGWPRIPPTLCSCTLGRFSAPFSVSGPRDWHLACQASASTTVDKHTLPLLVGGDLGALASDWAKTAVSTSVVDRMGRCEGLIRFIEYTGDAIASQAVQHGGSKIPCAVLKGMLKIYMQMHSVAILSAVVQNELVVIDPVLTVDDPESPGSLRMNDTIQGLVAMAT